MKNWRDWYRFLFLLLYIYFPSFTHLCTLYNVSNEIFHGKCDRKKANNVVAIEWVDVGKNKQKMEMDRNFDWIAINWRVLEKLFLQKDYHTSFHLEHSFEINHDSIGRCVYFLWLMAHAFVCCWFEKSIIDFYSCSSFLSLPLDIFTAL